MKELRGVFGILAAPYNEDGSLRPEDIRREVDFCVGCGSHGIAVPLAASEFFLLTSEERNLFLRTAAEQNAGRLPLIAGVAGTTTFESVAYTKLAKELGADAVIALPPYVLHLPEPLIRDYYCRIAEAADGVPVIIQNLPAPMGTPIPPETVIDLIGGIDGVSFVKEETEDSNNTIPRIIELAKALPEGKFKGLIGGKAGLNLVYEHGKGSCGSLPACQWVDLDAQVWDLLEEGKGEEAEELFALIEPLIALEIKYMSNVYREILTLRGVFENKVSRLPGLFKMDEDARSELHRLFDKASAYLRV